jgi:hypothetical protein
MNPNKFLLTAVTLTMTAFTTVLLAQPQWQWVGVVPAGVGEEGSISVIGPNTAVVAGGLVVARTTNGGVNWTTLNSPPPPDIYCVWARSENDIFIGDGGPNARIARTTNGGTSWATVYSFPTGATFVNGIVFMRNNNMIGVAESDPPAANGPAGWARTTDGGATWTPVTSISCGQFQAYNSVVIIDANFFGCGSGSLASIVFTTNGGTSWTCQSLGITGNFVSAFAFKENKLNGVAATSTSLPNIARTTNGGTSWSSQNIGSPPTAISRAQWVYGTDVVYVTGTTGLGVRRSLNGGATWTLMTSELSGIKHFDYFRDGNGVIHLYAVCTDQSIMRCRDSSLVGLDPNNQNVPAEYSLEQNYPNPFNPVTNIKYSLPKASNVTLKIYDVLGNEVLTVVSSYQGAGNYVETVDASSLASGAYFYKLTAGSFTDSKKMIVVK